MLICHVVEAHRADALVCISNCDKITPGMLMAALLRIERRACPTCGSCSGLFTANSMNCLVEALGLGLPGNGTLLATHTRRRGLFEKAGRTVVDLIDQWYGLDDERALPRVIAGRDAFCNAMTADISMGGSTNTVLHLIAAAREAGVDFDLDDVDRLSRRTPVLCTLAPSSARHIEDLHRAGGMIALLRQLDALGLPRWRAPRMARSNWIPGALAPRCDDEAWQLGRDRPLASPAPIRTS